MATVNQKILNALDIYDEVKNEYLEENFQGKVTGKGLSTNDYTDAEKAKLANVDTDSYVIKITGKGLSTNDYTTAEKTKLQGIAENANNYSLPTATSSVLGGVKTGSNITNTSGTISLTKANVTDALGYTPPTTNTTYSTGTANALGLTKLYGATGTNTDGTITQAVITTSLAGKLDSGATATAATKLATARNITTNLASTVAGSFNGTGNITPGVTGTLPVANGGTGQTNLSNVTVGKANQFTTGRALQVSLPSTAAVTLTGAADCKNIGVTGTLPIANGGTGLTASPSMLTNLASTTAANVLQASPRPGVTGTLPIANGGTGLTASPSMLTNLASTTAANVLQASPRPGVTGTLPIANGGTGATTVANARKALFGTDMSTTANFVIGITNSWADGGHISKANLPGWLGYGYAVCSTAAATAAKTVAVANFQLRTGSKVTVKFTNANTAKSPTLNVNSTGAKAIYYRGYPIAASYLQANDIYELVYDGTQWNILGFVNPRFTTTNFNVSWLPVGNPVVTTTNAKFDACLYCPFGSGVFCVNASDFSLGDTDFTIEFWMKMDNNATKNCFYLEGENGFKVILDVHSGQAYASYYINSSRINDSAYDKYYGSTPVHCAFQYNNTAHTFTVYAGGALVNSNSLTLGTANKIQRIELGISRASNRFSGSFEEFRISNTVRYTKAFTPTGPFTRDSNTLVLLHFD